jgi:hypothetical protein
MKRLVLTLILSLLAARGACALAPGDGVVVAFKDGSRVAGVLLEQTRSRIALDLGGAQMTFLLSDVSSVSAKKTSVQRLKEMLLQAGNDPGKLHEAGVFACAHRLYTECDRLVGGNPTAAPPPGAPAAAAAATPSAAPTRQATAPEPAEAATASSLPPLGFNTPGPAGVVANDPNVVWDGEPLVVGVALPPRSSRRDREDEKADQGELLKRQAEEREARRHETTTPASDFQFNLQQALDRQAHGLTFGPP